MVKFLIEKMGLQSDGLMLMPGTVLMLKSKPPGRWRPYGRVVTGREFEIATPPEGGEGTEGTEGGEGTEGTEGGEGTEGTEGGEDAQLDHLRRTYKVLSGEDPDKRWGVKRLTQEVQNYNG